MERTNRPYLLEKKSGAKDILIRIHHFYEAKLDDFGGAHKCEVGISHVDEDWMLPVEAKFCQKSYANQPGYYDGGSDAFTDVDGSTYEPLMSHHEMGHATGCFDDYTYSLEDGADTYGGLSSFDQPYTAPGGPYSLDRLATMYHCRVPRMRDFWHFVNWVNDLAPAGQALERFIKDTKFKMTYDAGAAGVIELDLDNAKYRDTCKPIDKQNFVLPAAGTGKADLLLYRLGGGETARTIDPNPDPAHVMNPRHIFDGILVVRTKLAVKFIDDTYGWTKNFKENWMQQSLKKPITDLNTYYLECNAANDFKKTLLIFMPFFSIYTGAAPAGAHFNVEVKFYYHPSHVPPLPHRATFNVAGSTLQVDNDVDTSKIMRHIFGKAAAGALVKADFNAVKDWLGDAGVANGTFSIKDLPA
jgi:hypothetical protein